jgi:hypothetical protein
MSRPPLLLHAVRRAPSGASMASNQPLTQPSRLAPLSLISQAVPDSLNFERRRPMKPGSDTKLTIPPALAAEIQAAADEEHRPALDVLRDAVEDYRKEQRWRRTLAYGADRAKALGVTEADVPRLIAAYRRERRQGLRPA